MVAKPKKIRVYSQHGEHENIHAIFGTMPGVAVDVGASDGVRCSNTKHLETHGWKVLCIEANPDYAARLKRNRKHALMVACGRQNLAELQDFSIYDSGKGNMDALSALDPNPHMVKLYTTAKLKRVTKVPVRTLDWCLDQARFTHVDLVSIDVEGGEADVLRGFNLARWSPKMVILEDWVGGQHRSYMCRKGYYIMNRKGVNETFLRADE